MEIRSGALHTEEAVAAALERLVVGAEEAGAGEEEPHASIYRSSDGGQTL